MAQEEALVSLVSDLKLKWESCEAEHPEVFRYKLNVTKDKVLDGNFKFYVQLNKDRAEKRRKPEKFESITPSFDESKFNFNKIDQNEVLLVEEFNGFPVLFLINNSPLTRYHLLVVPEVAENRPQIMTRQCLELAIDIMNSTDDKSVRLGYNSPGALASVNHLHLHLICLAQELYVEVVELKHLVSNLHKIGGPKYPVKGFCMISKDAKADAIKLHRLVEFCCDKMIPHNIFFTKSKTNELRVFFLPRTLGNFGVEKLYTSFLNVAFCEMSGYIPIGDEELFNTIDEKYILDRFGQEVQDICDTIEGDFVEILKDFE